jgi:L-amino acid N-acyltransferase YncA
VAEESGADFMGISNLLQKCSTALRLLNQDGVRGIVREAGRKIATVTRYRLDVIRVDHAAVLPQCAFAEEQFEIRFASSEDLYSIFQNWTDPLDELERHRKVVEIYGFKQCLLIIDRNLKRVAHFQFLLTHEDTEQVKKWFPWKIHRQLWGPEYAWQEWLYTFRDYRRRGLSVAGLKYLLAYCRERGIKRVYSHRGIENTASVKMAEKTGYERIGTVYQLEWFGRQRLSKMFVVFDHGGQAMSSTHTATPNV